MKRSDLSPIRGRRWLPWQRQLAAFSAESGGTPLLLLGLALCAGVTGCNVIPAAQTDPTRFYVLTSGSGGSPLASPESGGTPLLPAHRLRIGLKTIDVSTYLRGPEIVVRSGSNEVQLQDYARWAEPLQAGVTRLLREQLAAAPSISRVDVPPFPLDQERDFDVSVTILRCEGGRDGAKFEAAIQISTAGPTPAIVVHRIVTAPDAAWDGKNFGTLAGLLSADVQGLGDVIIGALPSP